MAARSSAVVAPGAGAPARTSAPISPRARCRGRKRIKDNACGTRPEAASHYIRSSGRLRRSGETKGVRRAADIINDRTSPAGQWSQEFRIRTALRRSLGGGEEPAAPGPTTRQRSAISEGIQFFESIPGAGTMPMDRARSFSHGWTCSSLIQRQFGRRPSMQRKGTAVASLQCPSIGAAVDSSFATSAGGAVTRAEGLPMTCRTRGARLAEGAAAMPRLHRLFRASL